MKLAAMALIATCATFPCFAADKNGTYTILSMGTKSCGEVVSDFKSDARQNLLNSVWVAGFITAVNAYVATRPNVAAGVDTASRDLWVHNYCSANPLENLGNAAVALATELSKRHP